MILVDFSQVLISNVMQEMVQAKVFSPDLDMFRHMVLNSLRSYRAKFGNEFGELVICCDGEGSSWRKNIFPYYKAARKKVKTESKFDWKEIYRNVEILTDEVAKFFPYKLIKIPHIEGDDIIGVLTKHTVVEFPNEKILILSGDKDFQQLQVFPNVQQYDSVRKKWIKTKNPRKFLIEHIARGDTSDSIPNCYSDDDVFVSSKRQKCMTKDRVKQILNAGNLEDVLNDDQHRNYKRNECLISFEFIPETIQSDIINKFVMQTVNSRAKLYDYFVKHNLRILFQFIQDF